MRSCSYSPVRCAAVLCWLGLLVLLNRRANEAFDVLLQLKWVLR
jgi:hypothetical protein